MLVCCGDLVAWRGAAVKLSLPLRSLVFVQAAAGGQPNRLCTIGTEAEDAFQKVINCC